MRADNFRAMLTASFLLICGIPALADDQISATREAVQLLQQGKRAEAEAVLRKRGAAGNDSATTMLGGILLRTNRVSEAVTVLRPLADRGFADAEWQLALAYTASSPPDAKLAKFWGTKAAADGNADARIAKAAAGAGLAADSRGKVSTPALIGQIKGGVNATIDGFNDTTLACYGGSRERLKTVLNDSVESCSATLPDDQRERIAPSVSFVSQFGQCVNGQILQSIGKTQDGIARCLPD